MVAAQKYIFDAEINGFIARIGTEVGPSNKYGLSGDDMEAMAFAWLAARTIANLSGNIASVTGARCETVLGAIYPVNSDEK